MGSDKARLRLGRRTLMAHVRRTAESLGFDVRVIRKDIVRRCGPLGGIYTGLKTSRHAAELFLSCDMPFVTRELLDELRQVKAPVFLEHQGRVGFPFILCVADVGVVMDQIRAGRLSLQDLAKRLKARRMRVRKVGQLFNVNTPKDWEEARRRLAELPL